MTALIATLIALLGAVALVSWAFDRKRGRG